MDVEQAEFLAQQAINNYTQEIPEGEGDHSCNECGFDSYLCPHLYERLKRHIVDVLTKHHEYKEGKEQVVLQSSLKSLWRRVCQR